MAKREMVLDMDDLSSISIECGHCTSRLSLALESWKGDIFSLGCPGCGESFFRDLPGHEPKLREVLRSLSRTFGQMSELAPHRLLFHVQEPPAPAKSRQSTVVYRPQYPNPMHRAQRL